MHMWWGLRIGFVCLSVGLPSVECYVTNYRVKRLLRPTETLHKSNMCVFGSDQSGYVVCISSSFLFNTVRFANCNTIKDLHKTDGGQTHS